MLFKRPTDTPETHLEEPVMLIVSPVFTREDKGEALSSLELAYLAIHGRGVGRDVDRLDAIQRCSVSICTFVPVMQVNSEYTQVN